MSIKPAKPSYAFPTTGDYGMTLRDYFAAAVLQGTMGNGEVADYFIGGSVPPKQFAKAVSLSAYTIADAMLEARRS